MTRITFGFTEDDFYSGVSHPVNPGLFRIMGQLNIVEQTGHGNLVIVDKYGKNAFTIRENYITVTIPFAFTPSMKQIDVNELTVTEGKVLMALKDNPTFTIRDISSFCQLSTSRIGDILRVLKERGKLERVGSKKGGYWRVL